MLIFRPSWSSPGFDSPEGFKVSFFNFCIMQVIKSISSFTEVMRDLRGCGSICLPSEIVPAFVNFCNEYGVYPCGGAVVLDSGDNLLQYLYLDSCSNPAPVLSL